MHAGEGFSPVNDTTGADGRSAETGNSMYLSISQLPTARKC